MKKKLMAVLLAIAMVLGASATVYASGTRPPIFPVYCGGVTSAVIECPIDYGNLQ